MAYAVAAAGIPSPAISSENGQNGEAMLTPAEVAARFRVNPKTVTRWAKEGADQLRPHARWAPSLPRKRGERTFAAHIIKSVTPWQARSLLSFRDRSNSR